MYYTFSCDKKLIFLFVVRMVARNGNIVNSLFFILGKTSKNVLHPHSNGEEAELLFRKH